MTELGVIGLGTMGANLARNAARNGARVPVYNRTTEKMEDFVHEFGSEGDIVGCKSIEEFLDAFSGTRAILIMVKSGDPVDAVIDELLPQLNEGDILIDGGNSHFPDTQRRFDALKQQGIHFIGMGVSGGEEGALNGPSMMPGADAKAYKQLAPLLESMSADDGIGGKCVSYIGPGGAGHFVKMVHNGIEYGLMQIIAEGYDVLRRLGNFDNTEIADFFASWSVSDELSSFLGDITAQIFTVKDDSIDSELIDMIVDRAGQKGTGKWTTIAALDLGVAIPTINAAVDARIISGSTDYRRSAKDYSMSYDDTDPLPGANQLRSMVRNSIILSSMLCYIQGFRLIAAASEENEWNINLSECARIWRGGCIIRSVLLELFQNLYSLKSGKSQAARERLIERFTPERQVEWRKLIQNAAAYGVPTPALSASLAYFDTLHSEKLPQNLIQAQRDFFGAHTFERIDKDGTFHSEWIN